MDDHSERAEEGDMAGLWCGVLSCVQPIEQCEAHCLGHLGWVLVPVP